MYSMDEAERFAAEFLRQKYEGHEFEVALFGEDKWRALKGEYYYFNWQSVKYIETGDDKYFLYGATFIAVHSVTGECRFLNIHECLAADPFSLPK
ncbi:hypothetical protein [Streptomyces sp. NPDC088196]|uniref:hypothetical protein n=1 Tax=Streptomyces sp. NPDC088196 TaxID=3154868 RepID=UPI00344E41C1